MTIPSATRAIKPAINRRLLPPVVVVWTAVGLGLARLIVGDGETFKLFSSYRYPDGVAVGLLAANGLALAVAVATGRGEGDADGVGRGVAGAGVAAGTYTTCGVGFGDGAVVQLSLVKF